jgi:hypothetical protein
MRLNAIRLSVGRERKCWKRRTGCILSAALISGLLSGASGQTNAVIPVAPPPAYVQPWQVPSNVREYMIAFGDRLQKPGNERLTLTGTATDSQKKVTPATLVWEVPGRLRFDRPGATASSLVFDDVSGLINATGVSQSDLDILETLLNDSPEAFLYSFPHGHAHRFLGGRFRTDGGKTANYSGPWFDIYESVATARTLSISPPTQKFFYFDSITKLHARTTYIVLRNSIKVPVSTEYGKWAVIDGQATPRQIVRNENGVPVFTFDINAASVGPALKDGLFPGH